jgi:hypothetical protein
MYRELFLTATGSVYAKIAHLDVDIEIALIRQECNKKSIPAFNATGVNLTVDAKFIEIEFPEGNVWTRIGR